MNLPRTIHELHRRLLAEEFSVVEYYQSLVRQIAQDQALNIWLSCVDDAHLLAQATRCDTMLKEHGDALFHPSSDRYMALFAVPVGLKDNICMRGLPTTAASRMLEHYHSPYDATVVTRLQQAGAIILGKLNMDEFGMGSSGKNSAFGATVNPRHPELIPGGSSSGSAAAVAAHHVLVALGSDTGGSCRQPAACCDLVGFKPTYGKISRYGLIAYASSLDCIGVIANNSSDIGVALDVIAGHDPHDSTSREDQKPSHKAPADMVVGVLSSMLDWAHCDPRISSACRDFVRMLEVAGVKCVPVHLDGVERLSSTYATIASSEASSNLARYTGLFFGANSNAMPDLDDFFGADTDDIDALMTEHRTRLLGPEVKKRILLGTHVLSAKNQAHYYARAVQQQHEVRRQFSDILSRVDVLFMPTMPCFPARQDAKQEPMLDRFMHDVYTIPANLTGCPALSFPVEVNSPHDRPAVSAQFMAAHAQDETLVNFVDYCQRLLKS